MSDGVRRVPGLEAAIEPELPIIDAHHHLRIRDGVRYLLADFLADLESGHDIRATVAVECSGFLRVRGPPDFRYVGETEALNGVAAMAASGSFGRTLVCAGIVGYADLRLGSRVQAVLDAHMIAGGARFRGIRNIALWDSFEPIRIKRTDPIPGLMSDEKFRKGFARLRQNGLSFDACVYHPQLAEVLDLARAFPDTVVILNHLGGPVGVGPYAGRRDEVLGSWRRSMSALAKSENVFVKLGGLGMPVAGFEFRRDQPPSSIDLANAWRPYVEASIDAFGVHRCMFESNFPADKATCSYGALWNAFKRIASACTDAERRALFSDTAARVYRLAVDS